ncbi:hypothetical protein BIFBIF_01381 [Bifidobacterium bifidum ATCC 29521 = JCM 1255 = DSM 20456]|nr:hypothetical protein BIFBIF_01381 [Bifidobacterium bifidum ATCC 29521 = JCM 1255 = DSM 20456]
MTEQGRFPGCVLAVLLRNSGVSRSVSLCRARRRCADELHARVDCARCP